MSKFLRRFLTTEAYNLATLFYPNVSLTMDNKNLHYNPYTSVTGITLNNNTLALEEGDIQLLVATIFPSTAANKSVTWSSSNTSIATVSSNGFVTAIDSGIVTITATTADGNFTDSCTVDIHSFKNDYLTFKILSSGDLAWKGVGGGCNKTIEYSLNNGSWTSITADTTAIEISVLTNDVVRFRGSNTAYSSDKNNYSAFYEGTATYNIEGNIMSLIYGDNFINLTTLTDDWALANVFNHSKAISAKNLILPATTLTSDCYRAMFANSALLTLPPALPATTLTTDCYYYMFDNCVSLTKAPELLATTLASKCYLGMFHITGATNSISYIKCLATPSTTDMQSWVQYSNTSGQCSVASSGIFVKASGTSWSTGVNGIPFGWEVYEGDFILTPVVSCDGEKITLTCSTSGAEIYYKLNLVGDYTVYNTPIPINSNVLLQTYAIKNNIQSAVVSLEYVTV